MSLPMSVDADMIILKHRSRLMGYSACFGMLARDSDGNGRHQ
jgi:hypothetical protein